MNQWLRDLVEVGVNLVKAEKAVEVQAKAEELADERVLDILIPPVKKTQAAPVVQENGEQPANGEESEALSKSENTRVDEIKSKKR